MKQSTKNIHIGVRESDPQFGSVVPPIYPSSTYRFPNTKTGAERFALREKGMIYSRFTNPTVEALEARLASMEGADRALATSSGMSAIVLTLLHYLKSGDSIIAHKVIYGGAYEFIAHILPRYGVHVQMVDCNNPAEIENAIDSTTKLIYFETPTNPLLEVIDIEQIVTIAKKHNITSVVDNTFTPPPFQYPYRMGIDIVLHSMTKFIGGHSDIVGGAIIGSKKRLDAIFAESYIFFGPTLSPFAAYLAMRGMTTMNIRMKAASENALKIAKFLEHHEAVEVVHYPGLASHSQHEIVNKQMHGMGSVLSFELKGGYVAGEKLANAVKTITLAVSLGGVESLIEHPASMTHSELSPDERAASGIRDGLLRLSVGLEDVEDIIADLTQALS